MIRVLHIVTRMDVGGSADDLLLLMTRMPPGEFASDLISGPTLDPLPGLTETLSRAGVPFTEVHQLVRPVSPIGDWHALWALRRAIRDAGPDIVHTHTSKAGFLGRLAARLAQVPRILHTPHGHIFHGYFGAAATRTFIVLERWAARFTDRIITLTDAEAHQHLALGIGRPDQFVTIPSGVDLAAVRAAAGRAPHVRGAVGALAPAPLLGAVSRLVPIKGLTHLLAAMPEILRHFPAAHLAIAGDGEERAGLEAQAVALGVSPRVHFLGFRSDVAAVISALDVFVLPSLNEGLGKALVEAMALGVPVVATRVGGVPEVVDDGRQGILVPPADPAALAKAILSLLEDPARAAAMGAAGRARAPDFSAEVMLRRHAELYRAVRLEPAPAARALRAATAGGPPGGVQGAARGVRRIAHIITRLDPGGSTRNTLLTAAAFGPPDFESWVIHGPSRVEPSGAATVGGGHAPRLVEVPALRRDVAPLGDIRSLITLYRLLRRGRFDIVHTHTSKAGFLGRTAARLARVPRILHTPHGHVYYGYFGPLATRAFVCMERWAARFTERIITLTDLEAAQHLALGVGRPGQFVTIPSGVDLARTREAATRGPQVRRALGLEAGAPLVGTVARLAPVKGITHLVEAMPEVLRRCPAAHLVIAGDGEERPPLEAQAAKLGVTSRIHFLGFCEDFEAVIAALDVFALPSLNEGMGRTLVMALALGVPVVATRVGGVPDVVEDGRQGLLVPPADPAALARAVAALLTDRARAAAMGEAGRARARHFGLEVMQERLERLYRGEGL